MKGLKCIAVILFIITLALPSYAQKKERSNIYELFITYMSEKLSLKPSQVEIITPIVKKYLNERKAIATNYDDPLIKERALVNLKINYRTQLSPEIGKEKANLFFTYELYFRRKIREELRKRKLEKIDSD